MAELRCKCGNEITVREKKLNAGLCDECFTEALRATAREISEQERRRRGN